MCLGLRGGHLPSVLWIAIALSIGFVQRAHAENFAEGARQAAAGQEVLSQNPARQQADYAVAAEAFRNGIAREPGSAAAWTQWADFALERFRILDLQLRSAQSGMARVLRFEAQGWHSGPETREELLRQSATAEDRKSTRLNSSHGYISYAVFCLKKKKRTQQHVPIQRHKVEYLFLLFTPQ